MKLPLHPKHGLKIVYFLLGILLLFQIHAQAQYQPVDPLFRDWTRNESTSDSLSPGMGYWPLDPLTAKNNLKKDTTSKSGFYNGKTKPMLWQYHSKDLNVSIIPWIDISYGRGNNNESEYESIRGLKLQGNLDQKFEFGMSYYENTEKLPDWVEPIAEQHAFVPQEGWGVLQQNGSWDISATEAWLQYLASNHFSVIAGYGRQFIGYGYRSLLLGDGTSNYPYLRLDWHSGPWRYEVSYNQFLNPGVQTNYSYMSYSYQRKNSILHYLSFTAGKNFEIGLFEHMLWLADDSSYNRGVELQYLNPIIFLHKVGYTLGSPDNDLIGMQATYKLGKSARIYSQVIIDDLNLNQTIATHEQNLNNKYAIQLGISKNKLFGITGLSSRLEWNTARPFIYGERTISLNYTHGDQPLADPLGANFHEFILQLNYHSGKWYGTFEQLVALQGKDEPGFISGQNLWGGEANVPFYGDYTLEGRKCTLSFTNLTVGYILNQANQLSIELSGTYRSYQAAADQTDPLLNQKQLFFQLGVKSLFLSKYVDY